MMKKLKIFSVLMMAAFALISCDRSTIEDPAKLTVTASTALIYADGNDQVVFTVKYGDTVLTAADVVAYDAISEIQVELPNLTFTTTSGGTHSFYFTYTTDGNTHKSNTVSVEAILLDLSPVEESGVTIKASTTAIQAGKGSTLLIVRKDGVVQDANKVSIYHGEKMLICEIVDYTDANGEQFKLHQFTSNELGVYEFWAMVGTSFSDTNNPLKITVVDVAVPKRPSDPQPASTSFHRRSLLMQYTGTGCGFCPNMMNAIHNMRNNEYADRFVLAAIHTYNNTDPMYINSPGLENMNLTKDYPAAVVDMKLFTANYSQVASLIDQSQRDSSTEAGISVNTSYSNGSVVALVTVKAAVENDFRVGAWLVEDDIYAVQADYATGVTIDINTHEAALRLPDSRRGSNNYSGYDLGSLRVGESGDHLFTMQVEEGWKAENCRLVVFVTSGPDYHVTNVIETESLTDTVVFDYAE